MHQLARLLADGQRFGADEALSKNFDWSADRNTSNQPLPLSPAIYRTCSKRQTSCTRGVATVTYLARNVEAVSSNSFIATTGSRREHILLQLIM